MVTNASGSYESLNDYYSFGEVRINQGNPSEQRKYTGHEYDSDTTLNYMNARYQSGKWGRFLTQDSVFLSVGDGYSIREKTGLDLDKYLADPQGLNSYAYARNNPLKLIDEDGQWHKEFFTGNQSWSAYQMELGEAANQLSQDSGAWNAALNHPYAAGAVVGVGAGVAAYGASSTLVQIGIGVNLGRLSQLPMLDRVNTPNKGFDNIQKATGLNKSEAVRLIEGVGKSLVDTRNSNNINTITTLGEKAIRITTNPGATKIISSGVMNASKIPSYISSGAMKSISTISSVAQSITRGITKLIK